mmetsp:Transcript_4237/g.19224  ORF Transcript_4237/g.19224 Transcript_4237/m.19224 type:complete len:200 (+) Transcript_4237:420-1019(+)
MCASKPTEKKHTNLRRTFVSASTSVSVSSSTPKPPPRVPRPLGTIVAVHMSSVERYAPATFRTMFAMDPPPYAAPQPDIRLSSLPVPRGSGATGARRVWGKCARSQASAMREAAAATVPSPPPARNRTRGGGTADAVRSPDGGCRSASPTRSSCKRRRSASWLSLSITSTSTLACSFLRRFTAIFAAGALTLTITHTRS